MEFPECQILQQKRSVTWKLCNFFRVNFAENNTFLSFVLWLDHSGVVNDDFKTK